VNSKAVGGDIMFAIGAQTAQMRVCAIV